MSGKSKGIGLLDFVADEARSAIRDVRQRLFEEAWFGRVVTGEPVMPVRDKHAAIEQEMALADLWETALTGKPARRDQSFEELWSPGKGEISATGREPEREGHCESAIDHVPDDQFIPER